MKLLPAPPQPIALLPAPKPLTPEEVRAWWEERFAEMDLKELLRAPFVMRRIVGMVRFATPPQQLSDEDIEMG